MYFVYDLSPIVVTIKENSRNFGHFITRLCAVLGGTFAVTGTDFVLRHHSMHIENLRHSLTSRSPTTRVICLVFYKPVYLFTFLALFNLVNCEYEAI